MYIPVPYFKGIPIMGDLEMDNIFLEIEYPILFTCRNKEKIFLCICRTVIEEQKWVISEITIEVLQKLIENKISIYDAFKEGTGYCCIAKWRKSTEREEYNVIERGRLSDNDLPKRTVFLDDDGESIEYLEKVKNRINQIACDKMNAHLECEQEEYLRMVQITIREEFEDYSNTLFDIDFMTCNTVSKVVVNHRNLGCDFIQTETEENSSEINDNLAA